MSLESTNYLTSDCNIDNLYWIIEKLGYEEVNDDLPNDLYIRNYRWMHPDRELTYVGVELSISKGDAGNLMVHTRTRMGRSYRELEHQNNTIRTIQNFFFLAVRLKRVVAMEYISTQMNVNPKKLMLLWLYIFKGGN